MSTGGDFFIKFLDPFFGGFAKIFKAFFEGLFDIFNVVNYVDIIKEYLKSDGSGKSFVIIISVLCLLSIFVLIGFLITKIILRFIKFRKNSHKQGALVEEIEDLNSDIIRLKQENEKFLSMANPDEGEIEYDENGNIVNKLTEGESRFFKLSTIDEEMKSYTPVTFNNDFELNEFCDRFRSFCAYDLKLYYDINLIRLFVSSFASNRLIILEGISGTGKTSLAYAMGKFINNETIIASVQPSWKDSTELFGYFNEFTKRFNESEVLRKVYEATYTEKVYLTLLDEMNISRVEYYFAEMLSILELPNPSQWIIELVPNRWELDPIKLNNGKLTIPENVWYIGTINNDDSTFMVTDKVYDRAMPIEIDEKSVEFEASKTESINLSYKYFESLFDKAQKNYKIQPENEIKINQMDSYIIEHFRISFGNRILKQIRDFVPVYMACGGEEINAIDYVVAHKILKKFNQLNLTYIKNETDDFVKYLDNLFGQDVMKECKKYLDNLKKLN
ncbi:MAG: hypothetical protein RSD96_01150 [Bacilli bacterium]